MSAAVLAAVPAGVGLGVGLWMLLGLVPRFGAPRLARRVAPAVADLSDEARRVATARPADPADVVGALLADPGGRPARALAAVLGDADAVRRRLAAADWRFGVDGYRARQLAAAAGGAALGLLAGVLVARGAAVPLVAPVGLGLLGLVAGALAPEQLLSRAVRRRTARLVDELPTVLDMLALALAAGEGVLDALRRVARVGNGDLAAELGRVAAQAGTGIPLGVALRRMSDDLDIPAVTRAVEQMVGALERGSPLADVLRAQAQDARDDAERRMLESAGSREIAMMVPLVFLILPVTVAFALAPGFMVLQIGF